MITSGEPSVAKGIINGIIFSVIFYGLLIGTIWTLL